MAETEGGDVQLVERAGGELRPPINRGRRTRLSPDDCTLLSSVDSIELVTFIHKPADHLAKLIAASKPFKFATTDADREAIARIKQDERSPPKREALIGGIYRNSRAAQRTAYEAARIELAQHLKTVKAYVAAKARIPAVLRTSARLKAAAIAADLQVAPTRGSTERAAKRRGRPRDDAQNHIKAHRKQWRWGGRGINKGATSNWRGGDYSCFEHDEAVTFIGAGGFASISELDLVYPESRDRAMKEIVVTDARMRREVQEFYARRDKQESGLANLFDSPTRRDEEET